jgi:hypothetical protein
LLSVVCGVFGFCGLFRVCACVCVIRLPQLFLPLVMSTMAMRSQRLGASSSSTASTFTSSINTCTALQDEYYKCRYQTVAHPLLRDRCNYQRAVALKCERYAPTPLQPFLTISLSLSLSRYCSNTTNLFLSLLSHPSSGLNRALSAQSQNISMDYRREDDVVVLSMDRNHSPLVKTTVDVHT